MSCKQCERAAEDGEELCIWHSLREGKEFERLEIRDEMFKDAHLARATFRNVSFNSCVFVDCDLSEAEFINSKILNCEFREGRRSLDLSQAKFLEETLIEDSTFVEADLSKSILDKSRVVDCTIRKSDWSQAVISRSEWENCSIDGGEFSGSEIQDTRIHNSQFRDVDMSKLSLQDCVIESSSFLGETDLSHCEFTNTIVASTDFPECDLSRALLREIDSINCDFSHADISSADLSGTNLENCKFVGSVLFGTNLQDALLYNAVFQYSSLKGASLDEVVKEERTAETDSSYDSRREGFERAQAIYRELKDYFHREGHYDRASHYRYREKVCNRKKRRWWEIRKHVSLAMDMFYGYGEKPFRLLIWWAVIIFGCAVGFSILGLHSPPDLWAAIQHSFGVFFGFQVLGAQESVPIVVIGMAESAIGKVMVVLLAAVVARTVN